jgi:hypothetical protein
MKKLFVISLLCSSPCLAQSDSQWALDSSTLSYHISHPLHEVDVKSFDSGDSNRDLHMIQVTQGARFPIVSVRLQLPEVALSSSTIVCDLDVQFAGQTAHYQHLTFQQVVQGNEHRVTGTIPSTLSDFKIPPPSFFTVPLKNEMPVKVDIMWHPL